MCLKCINKVIVPYNEWYEGILNVGIHNIHSYVILTLCDHIPILGLLNYYFHMLIAAALVYF